MTTPTTHETKQNKVNSQTDARWGDEAEAERSYPVAVPCTDKPADVDDAAIPEGYHQSFAAHASAVTSIRHWVPSELTEDGLVPGQAATASLYSVSIVPLRIERHGFAAFLLTGPVPNVLAAASMLLGTVETQMNFSKDADLDTRVFRGTCTIARPILGALECGDDGNLEWVRETSGAEIDVRESECSGMRRDVSVCGAASSVQLAIGMLISCVLRTREGDLPLFLPHTTAHDEALQVRAVAASAEQAKTSVAESSGYVRYFKRTLGVEVWAEAGTDDQLELFVMGGERAVDLACKQIIQLISDAEEEKSTR